jgi:hypothetical protein
MDFEKIVLRGYFGETSKEYLNTYFLREYKKAEKKQFFEANEFFKGCLKVIEDWEKHLKDLVTKRKNELLLMLNAAENGTLNYHEVDGKDIEQKRLDTIEYCKRELKDVRPDGIGSLSFTIHLFRLTNGQFSHNLTLNEVLQIKASILKAYEKAQNNKVVQQAPELSVRLKIKAFTREYRQTSHEYRFFQNEIENNGCINFKNGTDSAKVYTPELAVILTSKKLAALNMETKTTTEINGPEYLQTYIEAFQKGEKYFETEFKVSPTTLYGEHAEQYVKDLQFNFFHKQHTGINEGWGYVKKQYPFIVNDQTIKEYGYFAGIVSKVEEQINKCPRLFANFDEGEQELQPQPIVKEKPELKIDQIALKYAYEGLRITRENGNDIAKEYGHNSGEKLFQRFTYFSSSANRKGKPNLCTPKKLDNKIKLIESIIELLPTDKQERAKDEVSILKKIYEAEYQ